MIHPSAVKVVLGKAAPLWDEFHPARQRLTLVLQSPERDVREVTFGLRNISTSGTQITINGQKTFLRGTLECAVFPKTGHPPTEVAEWKRLIGVARRQPRKLHRMRQMCHVLSHGD